MEIKPFDLVQTLETNLSPFQTQAKSQDKDFQISINVKDRMIKGDPARLGQVINNLVSNAMKFTKAGDRLSVSLRQMDEGKRNNYLFSIEDTGAGMSPEFLPKLFDPYEREVRFGAKDVMGTGLGMPIVKNLVTCMGGQIAVNSVLGQGTTFSVTIPFDASEAPLPEAEQPPQEDILLEGWHILLAEDIVRTTQAGMDAHLAKPVNIEQLCVTLTKLMPVREHAREENSNKEE